MECYTCGNRLGGECVYCGEMVCEDCVTYCDGCGEPHCGRCILDSGLCENCQAKEEDEEE